MNLDLFLVFYPYMKPARTGDPIYVFFFFFSTASKFCDRKFISNIICEALKQKQYKT